MSSENIIKNESENLSKSILSPANRNRTILLKRFDSKKVDLNTDKSDVESSDIGEINGGSTPKIQVIPAKIMNKIQESSKDNNKNDSSRELSNSLLKKDLSLTSKTISNLSSSGLLGLSGKLKEKKMFASQFAPKVSEVKSPAGSNSPIQNKIKNQMSKKIMNLGKKIVNLKEKNLDPSEVDYLNSKLVPTKKQNINERSHLFGHEPKTYTTNPLIIEDLIDELEEKAKNYFILFSKERKEREKLERQCYWMQEENKTLQNTLKNQITTIQGLQNKIIDLRGNPNVITETIERIDMLYTQLDTLIQAFAGVCSYITFNEPTDRREILELVLEYLHPCRGLDLRLNSLYGSIYYFKLGIVKDLPPPIQPPEKIPGYDVWQPPPPPQVSENKDEEAAKLLPHMQQGNSLTKVVDTYMKAEAQVSKTSVTENLNKEETNAPKLLTPVASTKQVTIPINSSQLTGDSNIPLSGFEVKIKSAEKIEQIGDGKGKIFFVARIDNESSLQCKNNPKRKSKEFDYKISPIDNKGIIESEIVLEIDTLPPKSPGLLPRFTIDMWDSSITSGPIGHASRTFIDPSTLVPEQYWDVLTEDGEKIVATIIVTINPKPGNSMLPAGRYILAKESKNKQESNVRKESKLSRLSFRSDKEKGLDKINSILRPGINFMRKTSKLNDDKDEDKVDDKDNSKNVTNKAENNTSKSNNLDLKHDSNVLKKISSNVKDNSDISKMNKPLSNTKETNNINMNKNDLLKQNNDKDHSISKNDSIKTSNLEQVKKFSDSTNPVKIDLKSPIKIEPKIDVIKNGIKNDNIKNNDIKVSIKDEVSKSINSKLNISKSIKKVDIKQDELINTKNSITLKKSTTNDSVPKQVDKNEIDNNIVKAVKPTTTIKITPKIVTKPIVKDNNISNVKTLQTNTVNPTKLAPIPIIKKIDVKPPAIKPKTLAPAPLINIKKPGNTITIKPKNLVGLDGAKPAITITPKIVATPPKPALGATSSKTQASQIK